MPEIVLPIGLASVCCAIALTATLRGLSALKLTAQSAKYASSLLQFGVLKAQGPSFPYPGVGIVLEVGESHS